MARPEGTRRGLMARLAGLLRDPEGKVATSAVALVLANAVPLLGVAFLGWDALVVVGLYWMENLVIGGITVLRIVPAGGWDPLESVGNVLAVPFFCLKYGAFTFVHGVLVFALLGGGSPDFERFWLDGPLAMLMESVRTLMERGGVGVRVAIAALVVSHGVSFVTNYVGKGEYLRADAAQEMERPYGRVVMMHTVVLVGALLAKVCPAPMALLLVLVVLKTIVDLWAHDREHVEER